MIGGPIATTSSMSECLCDRSRDASVTRPLMPAEPSSVQTISSSQQRAELVLPEDQVSVAEAERRRSRTRRSPCSRAPADRSARRRGRRRRRRPSVAVPNGSARPSARPAHKSASPTRQRCCISRVVLPTAWITSVTVPFSRSKSAIVSGMRSPCSCYITITNWPGRAAFAISGWRTSSM